MGELETLYLSKCWWERPEIGIETKFSSSWRTLWVGAWYGSKNGPQTDWQGSSSSEHRKNKCWSSRQHFTRVQCTHWTIMPRMDINILKIQRYWFNALNVKSVDYGTKTRDERRKSIWREHNSEQLSFLRSMACWFEKWQRDYGSSSGLTNPTFKAVIRTANGIPLMAEYLFEMQSYLSYLLLRNIQSDYIEGRFGWLCQLCGGNYFNTVSNFLQAGKNSPCRFPCKHGL